MYAHVNGDRIAATLRRPVMVALVWLAALSKFIRAFTNLPPLADRLDFVNYYDSALALRLGIDPYTADLTTIGNRLGVETGPHIHASETPAFLLCFEPLTRLPPAIAFWIWTSVSLAALAIAIYLLLVRRPGLDASTAWLLGALIVAFYPVDWNFLWAQSQVIVLALMVLAMRAMEDEREGAAGLIVAFAGLLRAFPFLLLGYFAVRREWKALKFAIAGTIAGASIAIAMLGLAQCLSFFGGAAFQVSRGRMLTPFAISAAPFVSRMFWALFGSASGVAADWLRLAAIAAVDAIILGATIHATLAGAGRRDTDYRIYSLWIAASVLLSPIAYHHYLVLLVVPFVQIVVAASQHRASRRALWMAAGSYLLASVSVAIAYRLMTPVNEFELALPSRPSPMLETGFFTLLMGYIAAYWFATDSSTQPRQALS